ARGQPRRHRASPVTRAGDAPGPGERPAPRVPGLDGAVPERARPSRRRAHADGSRDPRSGGSSEVTTGVSRSAGTRAGSAPAIASTSPLLVPTRTVVVRTGRPYLRPGSQLLR